jgi:hypothetical protein
MSWLDRYIEAVRRYLPAAQREDVGEEIRSLLQDQIDDRADGSVETGDQVALDVLREFGHPLKVAAGYQDRRVLISEPLFPIYKQVLKYLSVALLSLFVLSAVLVITGIRPAGLGIDWIWTWLLYFALITLVFHLADRQLQSVDFFARWDPRRLPPATSAVPAIPLSDSIAAIPFILVWFWLLSMISNDYSVAALLGRGESLVPSFVLWLKIQALLALATNLANVVRPWWTIPKLAIEIASSTLFVFIAGRALVLPMISGYLVGIGYVGDSAWLDDGLPGGIDLVIRGVLVTLIVVALAEIVSSVRKILKLRSAA